MLLPLFSFCEASLAPVRPCRAALANCALTLAPPRPTRPICESGRLLRTLMALFEVFVRVEPPVEALDPVKYVIALVLLIPLKFL